MTGSMHKALIAASCLALASCGGKKDRDADAEDDVLDVTVPDITDTLEPLEDPTDDPTEEEEDVVEEEDAPPPLSDLLYVYTVAGDYSAGSYTVLETDTMTAHPDLATMHTDGKALCLVDRVFLNELMGADTVDPIDTLDPWSVISRHDVGDDTNPVDAILRDATRMLVVQYNGAGLVELNLVSGTLTSTTVDLSSFDANDALPQAHAIAHVGTRYFVSLQRLNGWTAEDPGLVVVLDDTSLEIIDADPSTTTTVDAITLPGTNPVGRFRVLGSNLYVALVGAWGATDGGIAVVDTSTLTASWAIQSSSIGGDPVFGDCWEIIDATTAFVCYGLTDGSADAVKSFDPSAGTAGTTDILTTSSGSLSGSALTTDGRMIVGDRDSTSPGLRVIDVSTSTETTTAPLSTGTHPPYAMCFHSSE